jgi:hypothetical protein
MKRRLVATLLVLSVARAARAGEANVAEVVPPLEPTPAAAPPALPQPPPAAVVVAPTAVVVVEPVAPASGAGPLVAGVLTLLVPFVVGCGLWSTNNGDLEKAGTTVMAAGFAAAPWVSHGLQRRWKRAAIFGSFSAATSAATLIAMEAKDPFVAQYANRQRVAFGVFLTSALFAAALGVFDSFLVAPARETP